MIAAQWKNTALITFAPARLQYLMATETSNANWFAAAGRPTTPPPGRLRRRYACFSGQVVALVIESFRANTGGG